MSILRPRKDFLTLVADRAKQQVQPQTMLSSCRIRDADYRRVCKFKIPALGQKRTAEQGSRTNRRTVGFWRVGFAKARGRDTGYFRDVEGLKSRSQILSAHATLAYSALYIQLLTAMKV